MQPSERSERKTAQRKSAKPKRSRAAALLFCLAPRRCGGQHAHTRAAAARAPRPIAIVLASFPLSMTDDIGGRTMPHRRPCLSPSLPTTGACYPLTVGVAVAP
eukprot:scaffold22058_cov124-Isochrysis_galbana.AAC.3